MICVHFSIVVTGSMTIFWGFIHIRGMGGNLLSNSSFWMIC